MYSKKYKAKYYDYTILVQYIVFIFLTKLLRNTDIGFGHDAF